MSATRHSQPLAGGSALPAASDELLRQDRSALLHGIADLTRRSALHRQLLEQLEVELATQTRLLREIDELMDLRPQLRLERLDRQLRGRRLQEVAVELLRRRRGNEPVHYREWFAFLRAEGYEVSGRDPLATFLTQVSRADGVERVIGRLAPILAIGSVIDRCRRNAQTNSSSRNWR